MRRILTNEDLRRYANYDNGDAGEVARMLLAERAEREKNPGVWDDAPEWADEAVVSWSSEIKSMIGASYTRMLPKTKAREIADERCKLVPNITDAQRMILAAIIEAAILEAQKDGEK